jgi:hypothetical protein
VEQRSIWSLCKIKTPYKKQKKSNQKNITSKGHIPFSFRGFGGSGGFFKSPKGNWVLRELSANPPEPPNPRKKLQGLFCRFGVGAPYFVMSDSQEFFPSNTFPSASPTGEAYGDPGSSKIERPSDGLKGFKAPGHYQVKMPAFDDFEIPSQEAVDAFLSGSGRNPEANGEIPDIGVESAKTKSARKVEMTQAITALYDRLKMKWSWNSLWWDEAGGKKATLGHTRNYCDPGDSTVITKKGKTVKGKAIVVYCDPKDDERYEKFFAIDVDTDNEHTRTVESLIGDGCNMIAKTRKGHHYIFKHTTALGQTSNTQYGIDIRNACSDGILYAEPSSYIHPTHGLVAYKWVKTPAEGEGLMEVPGPVVEYLHSLGYSAVHSPEKKAERVPTVAEPKAPASEDEFSVLNVSTGMVPDRLAEINNLLRCLTPEWLKERENWMRLGFCLKGLNGSTEMRELFVAHSARADPKYDTVSGRQSNREWFDGQMPKGRINKNSLKHWAKRCNPQMYFNFAKGDYWRLFEGGGNAPNICEAFYIAMGGDIVYSPGQKCYYVYDPLEKLWKGGDNDGSKSHINNLFTQTLHNLISGLMSELPIATTDAERIEREGKIKLLNSLKQRTDGQSAVAMVNNNLPAICCLAEDPANFFNQQQYLLPLANGVWDFEAGKLVPYEREFYFTFRIPINYNPKASTVDIEKAMNDWFKGDEEVISFMRFYIGYIMTGSRERQDMLGVWGSTAGNGKSLLWGEIVPDLLGGENCYYSKITSEAFTNFRQGDSNDQIFQLNGKRYAFLSEPRKKFDTNMIKELTGDKHFKVRTLYKGCITFTCITKIVMAFNNLPELDFVEDNGMARRFQTVEQNTPFVKPAEYANLSEEVKARGEIKCQDSEFVERLKKNMEGTLLWALGGASEFMKNKKREVPEAMKKTKSKATNEADSMGAWCRQHIVATEDDKDRIKISDLKRRWRDDGHQFGQNEKTFVRKFLDRINVLVPGVVADPGREGKGEARLKRARLVVPEDSDAEE